ncbi:hypothetical protein MKEN_01128400 [Mycena kentingensis (nom. inval.)]|nr:hypothetical protein MKEN_01128400 [Mycena kentingensis (nom. inval.)]
MIFYPSNRQLVSRRELEDDLVDIQAFADRSPSGAAATSVHNDLHVENLKQVPLDGPFALQLTANVEAIVFYGSGNGAEATAQALADTSGFVVFIDDESARPVFCTGRQWSASASEDTELGDSAPDVNNTMQSSKDTSGDGNQLRNEQKDEEEGGGEGPGDMDRGNPATQGFHRGHLIVIADGSNKGCTIKLTSRYYNPTVPWAGAPSPQLTNHCWVSVHGSATIALGKCYSTLAFVIAESVMIHPCVLKCGYTASAVVGQDKSTLVQASPTKPRTVVTSSYSGRQRHGGDDYDGVVFHYGGDAADVEFGAGLILDEGMYAQGDVKVMGVNSHQFTLWTDNPLTGHLVFANFVLPEATTSKAQRWEAAFMLQSNQLEAAEHVHKPTTNMADTSTTIRANKTDCPWTPNLSFLCGPTYNRLSRISETGDSVVIPFKA